MTNIDTLIANYLQSKKDAWAPTTLKSERHRLNSIKALIGNDAQKLWDGIRTQASPYTRVTVWVRVTDFYEWCIENAHAAGPNPYRKWKREHAKQFKNAYNPNLPDISYVDAIRQIESITDPSARRRALEMVGAGTRWCESVQRGNTVTGKGSKQRRVYVPDVAGPEFVKSYRTFLRALTAVGLKPHMLRKLCATRLAHGGAREADLLKLMGWESFATAKNYIAPVEEARLRALMTSAQNIGEPTDGIRKK